MTLGEFKAQAGHAGMIAAALLAGDDGDPAVRDAGFTAIPAGTITVIARAPGP